MANLTEVSSSLGESFRVSAANSIAAPAEMQQSSALSTSVTSFFLTLKVMFFDTSKS